MSKSCSRCPACQEIKALAQDGTKMAKKSSKASSTGSVKSNNSNLSPTPKKCRKCNKDNTESIKKCRSNDGKPKLDPASVNQLKMDLELIKQQLFAMNANRTEALDISKELQERYTNLSLKNQKQEAEIAELKRQNCMLSESMNNPDIKDLKKRFQRLSVSSQEQQEEIERLKLQNMRLEDSVKEQAALDETTVHALEHTRASLDECEKKLSSIYTDLLQTSKEEITRTKSLLNEKEQEIASMRENLERSKQLEEQYDRDNKELSRKVEELETTLAETVNKMEQIQNESEKHRDDLTQLQEFYQDQLDHKSQRLDELSLTVDKLQQHVCECKEKTHELHMVEQKYEELKSSHQSLLRDLDESTETLKLKSMQVEKLKENSSHIVDEYVALKSFVEELKSIIKENDVKIAELNRLVQQKDEHLDILQEQVAEKDRKIEVLMRSQKQAQVSSCPNSCEIPLTEDLQNLINTLYEEIDSTLAKDDQIEKQYQNICCLECKLADKERELSSLHTELKFLHNQFTRVVREKAELVSHLKQLEEARYESSECECP